MKDFLKDLLLYISSFVPMYFLIFIRLIVEIINDNLSFNILNTLNFVTLLILILSGCFGLVWNVKYSTLKEMEIEITFQQNITERHFLGYFSLFVFFAIPLDLSYVSVYCVYILVLVMIGIVYINNSLYYINPLLNLLGYNFYDVEYIEIGSNEKKKAKVFCKGNLIEKGNTCKVKIKNEHFMFVDKDKL